VTKVTSKSRFIVDYPAGGCHDEIMSPKLLAFATKIGVQLSDRHAEGGFVYDGLSIATRRNAERAYSSHDILHEICHWIVADTCQRDLPEFGLMMAIADPTANGSLYYSDADFYYISDGLVDAVEQDRQEILAQRLCCYIGFTLGLSPDMSDLRLGSWKAYEAFKREESPQTWSAVEEAFALLAPIFRSLVARLSTEPPRPPRPLDCGHRWSTWWRPGNPASVSLERPQGHSPHPGSA
jgi:hypothetical protein